MGGMKSRSSARTKEKTKGFGRRKSDSPRVTSIVTEDDDGSGINTRIQSYTPTAITTGCGGGDGTSSAHDDLVSWIRRNPNAHVSPKFVVRPSSLGGMGGFVCESPMSEGELILRLPRDGCCISQDDALSDPNCGDAFRRGIVDAKLPSRGMILVAGWIAMERAASIFARRRRGRRRRARMGGSRMPYLRSIPWDRQGQDHVLHWSDEEVRELLGGSRAHDDAMLIRRTVDDVVVLLRDILTPIVRMAEVVLSSGEGFDRGDTDDDDTDDDCYNADDDSSPGAILDEAIRGAFVIALTRSFAEEVEYENADGTTKVEVENVLLPLIDILQHANDPNTILEPYDDCVLLRARRDVGIGEELFHRYQEENDAVIPPHKFFTRYGFVPGIKDPIVELLKGRSPLFFDS